MRYQFSVTDGRKVLSVYSDDDASELWQTDQWGQITRLASFTLDGISELVNTYMAAEFTLTDARAAWPSIAQRMAAR